MLQLQGFKNSGFNSCDDAESLMIPLGALNYVVHVQENL